MILIWTNHYVNNCNHFEFFTLFFIKLDDKVTASGFLFAPRVFPFTLTCRARLLWSRSLLSLLLQYQKILLVSNELLLKSSLPKLVHWWVITTPTKHSVPAKMLFKRVLAHFARQHKWTPIVQEVSCCLNEWIDWSAKIKREFMVMFSTWCC
jgi:hypothetical protein